jgi:hypothetical protein
VAGMLRQRHFEPQNSVPATLAKTASKWRRLK